MGFLALLSSLLTITIVGSFLNSMLPSFTTTSGRSFIRRPSVPPSLVNIFLKPDSGHCHKGHAALAPFIRIM